MCRWAANGERIADVPGENCDGVQKFGICGNRMQLEQVGVVKRARPVPGIQAMNFPYGQKNSTVETIMRRPSGSVKLAFQLREVYPFGYCAIQTESLIGLVKCLSQPERGTAFLYLTKNT